MAGDAPQQREYTHVSHLIMNLTDICNNGQTWSVKCIPSVCLPLLCLYFRFYEILYMRCQTLLQVRSATTLRPQLCPLFAFYILQAFYNKSYYRMHSPHSRESLVTAEVALRPFLP